MRAVWLPRLSKPYHWALVAILVTILWVLSDMLTISFYLLHLPQLSVAYLKECEDFAQYMDIVFNAAKTQLICFRLNQRLNLGQFSFNFCDLPLQFTDKVKHLGHFYRYNLDDSEDIKRVSDDMCRKAKFLLHSFRSCDPVAKPFLFSSHCLSLYGALSWKLSCPKLKSLEVTFNNILQKTWHLPRRCHTGILHCTATASSILLLNFLLLHTRELLQANVT